MCSPSIAAARSHRAGSGIERDQNEPGKMSVDAEAIAGAVAIEAERGPKQSSNLIAR